MLKVIKFIRNFIITIFLLIYLSLILGASVLLLSKNDYGTIILGEDALVPITSMNANSNYQKNDLVIVEQIDFKNIKVNDEIFVYKTDVQNNSVLVISNFVKEINYEDENLTLNDDTVWGKEYVTGKAKKVYGDIGAILNFVISKWIFFVIFIIPCFLILIYEFYLLIITVKYGDEEDVEYKEDVKNNNFTLNKDTINKIEPDDRLNNIRINNINLYNSFGEEKNIGGTEKDEER